MVDKWIPEEKVYEELVRLGIPKIGIGIGILRGFDKRGLHESDLELYRKAIFALGPKTLNELAEYSFQVGMPKQWSKLNTSEQAKMAIRAFYRPLRAILNDKSLGMKGYHLRLCGLSELTPTPFRIDIDKGGKIGPANLEFGLFFNEKQEPCVIFGSMQGHSREAVEEFKGKTGQNILEFFADKFKKAFPKSRLFALNPKFHYYQAPHRGVVLGKLKDKGQISREEMFSYRLATEHLDKHGPQFLRPHFPAAIAGVPEYINLEAVRKVHPLVQQRIHDIITTETGMHKAAYKKAGFQQSEQKLWPLKRARRR